MGDGELAPVSGPPAISPATGRPDQRGLRRCRQDRPAKFPSARLAITLAIGGALLIPAAGCAGGSDTGVTPLAGAAAATSTTAPSDAGDLGTATSSTAKAKATPSTTSATNPPPDGSSDSAESTVTPTSAPSAERFADGSVVSAGGYEAKTPAVARGLLLEPKWTKKQQAAADVIHEYLDAMITTVTDKKPDTKIPTSMTDLERPDLNSAGLVQLDTQNLVRGATRLNQYMVEPEGSETAYWVFDLSTLEGGRLQVAMCDYNDLLGRDLDTDAVVDDATTSAFWDGQLAPTDQGWRVVTLLHQGAKKGRAGCAAE